MKTRLKKLLAIFGAVALTLAAVEVASFCFLTGADLLAGRRLSVALLSRAAEIGFAWKHHAAASTFDPLVQIRHIPGNAYHGLSVNENGFIGNGPGEPSLAEAYPEKPPGLFRVLLLGGSTTAGFGVSDNRKTIAAQLERSLNEKPPVEGMRFQVLNLASAGGYTGQELALFVFHAIYLAPDAVMMLDGFNDAVNIICEPAKRGLPHGVLNWFDHSYETFEYMNGLGGPPLPRSRFMTWAFLAADRIGRRRQGQDLKKLYRDYPFYRLSARVLQKDPYARACLENNLRAMAAICGQRKIPLFCYLQPWSGNGRKALTDGEEERIRRWYDSLAAVFPGVSRARYEELVNGALGAYGEAYAELGGDPEGLGATFADLAGLFTGVREETYFDALHFTEEGNRLVAERYFQDLSRRLAGP